jgi:hypothetical protein
MTVEEKNRHAHNATLEYFKGNKTTPVFKQIKNAILKKKIIICLGTAVAVVIWCFQRATIVNAIHDIWKWL